MEEWTCWDGFASQHYKPVSSVGLRCQAAGRISYSFQIKVEAKCLVIDHSGDRKDEKLFNIPY